VIEPQGTSFTTDSNSRASANIAKAGKNLFREAVVIVQDNLQAVQEMAFNYRTEPISYRYLDPDFFTNGPSLSPFGIARAQSNGLLNADPQTPVFVAEAGLPLRMRVLHPAGLNEQVFELHGHTWQEEPYSKGSLAIVDNNPMSQWTGSRDTFGANASFDIVLKHAGGANAVKGDYMFRTFIGQDFQNGMWGLLRVGDKGQDVVTVTTYCAPPTMSFTVAGTNTVNPSTGRMAATVTIAGAGLPTIPPVPVNPMTGQWTFTSASVTSLPAEVSVTSAGGRKIVVRPSPNLCPIQQPSAPTPTLAPSTKDVDRFRQAAPSPKATALGAKPPSSQQR